MAEVAGAEQQAVGSAGEESDFSPRKIRIATVCLFGMLFATSLLPFGAIGLVMLPMTGEFGWSRTEFSFATTALMWCGALSVPFLGQLTDRIGARPVILVGTVVVGLITLAMSLQTASLPQLYLYYALLGVFGSSGVAYSKVIASLFTQHRGKALAVFGVESTIAASLLPMITNAIMTHYGWRGVYVAFGCVILALLPLLYFFLEEPGRPLASSATPTRMAAPPVRYGMTAGQAVRDRVFWLLVVASVVGAAPGSAMITHMVAAIVDRGFSSTLAASLMSVSMLIGIVGTMTGGYLVDRVQTAKINAPFTLLAALGIFLLSIVTTRFGGVPLLVTALVLNAIAFAAAMSMGTYFRTRFFGLGSFTVISGIASAILAVAMGFATPLMGLIFDRSHSYAIAFAVMIGGSVISALIYLVLGPYRYAADAEATPLDRATRRRPA